MDMVNGKLLFDPRFPRSNKYQEDWIFRNVMGINPLWLTEWVCSGLDLHPGMRVLDLGCGKALSSVFLAREYGVRVWAYDLWIDAADNWKRIREQGLDNEICPLHGDARQMPFADHFSTLWCASIPTYTMEPTICI